MSQPLGTRKSQGRRGPKASPEVEGGVCKEGLGATWPKWQQEGAWV